jgi:hypothetical protein
VRYSNQVLGLVIRAIDVEDGVDETGAAADDPGAEWPAP